MVRKLTEVCSITFSSWEDQCWTCLESSVKAIKRQDNAEGPAVPGCERKEGKMRYQGRERKNHFSASDGPPKPRCLQRC